MEKLQFLVDMYKEKKKFHFIKWTQVINGERLVKSGHKETKFQTREAPKGSTITMKG